MLINLEENCAACLSCKWKKIPQSYEDVATPNFFCRIAIVLIFYQSNTIFVTFVKLIVSLIKNYQNLKNMNSGLMTQTSIHNLILTGI